MSLEEARDYICVGCVGVDLPGKEYGWHDAAYVNTPKMMEMVMNGGRSMNTGKQLAQIQEALRHTRHLMRCWKVLTHSSSTGQIRCAQACA